MTTDRYSIFPERIQTRDGVDYYYPCGDCGSLVKNQDQHDAFHDLISAAYDAIGTLNTTTAETADRVYMLEIACTPDVVGV